MRLPTLIAASVLCSATPAAPTQADFSALAARAQRTPAGAGSEIRSQRALPQSILPQSVVFFSPNTTEALRDEDALAALHSFAEANAVAVADRAACALGQGGAVHPGLGIFDTWAENSVWVEGAWDAETTAYLAVLLARYEHQQWAFWFRADPAGKDRLWLLVSASPAAEIARGVRAAGLAPVTETLGPGRNVVVVVAGETAAAGIAKLAADLQASVSSEAGTSARMGSETSSGTEGAQAAVPLYDAAIHRFERTRHVTLSRKLWTAAWRDATGRTCAIDRSFVTQ